MTGRPSSHSGKPRHGGVRISGGSLKGRTIPVPPGIIRPAMDKMRESVFAILGDLSGASFLDLFSGSLIIALEAASRGASHIEAVEGDKQKLKTLIANSALSPVRIHCHLMPVELFIKRAHRSGTEQTAQTGAARTFDYIFCDPPFNYQYKSELVANIGASSLMNESSLLMIHHPKKDALYDQENLALKETRFYGNSAVDFFTRRS
jgi:16S rRNA (guanine(966)-N(2))-methyltransferase RsmD